MIMLTIKKLLSDIAHVPGVYEIDLITTVRKNKLVQEIGGVTYIKEIDLFEDLEG